MARFGIRAAHVYGIGMPVLRKIAGKLGVNHTLATQLWRSGVHEARILASIIDDPLLVTSRQMDRWAKDCDSWDVCDQCCMNLFRYSPRAYAQAAAWTGRKEEYVKRAGFSLVACLAVGDKKTDDRKFVRFFPHIVRGASDGRTMVRKAVNWSLRQIGKRSLWLNARAVQCARDIQRQGDRGSQWVARDALRELTGEAVMRRLRRKHTRPVQGTNALRHML